MRLSPVVPWLPLAAGLLTGCTGVPPALGGVEPSRSGALPSTLAWSDEFDSTSLDQRSWVHDTRLPGPGDPMRYGASQASVAAGNLVIRADHGDRDARHRYVSDAVSTYGKVTFTYGYVEARMKLPRGRGLTPAFFLYPQALTANGYHEIDIAEFRGQFPFTMHQQIAFGPDSDRIDWKTGSFYYRSPVDLTLDFHTYGVHWEPGRLTWYVDGEPTYMQTAGVPSEPMYVVLSFAVGGSYAGPPDGSTSFPSDLRVDYVRLYQ